jgi:hypothetical protein
MALILLRLLDDSIRASPIWTEENLHGRVVEGALGGPSREIEEKKDKDH